MLGPRALRQQPDLHMRFRLVRHRLLLENMPAGLYRARILPQRHLLLSAGMGRLRLLSCGVPRRLRSKWPVRRPELRMRDGMDRL